MSQQNNQGGNQNPQEQSQRSGQQGSEQMNSQQQGAQRSGSLDQDQEVINQRELESERMEQDDNQRHIQESTKDEGGSSMGQGRN